MSEQHKWIKYKDYKWSVCARCDLVLLKNKATEKAVKEPCIGQYIRADVPKKYKTAIPTG